MDEDQARTEAEARRQRILDSANKRMDQVNGLSGGDGKEAEENSGTKKASKLAAMRRRRFKKTPGDGLSTPSTEEAPVANEEATPEAPKVESKEATPPAPAPAAQQETVATTTETAESSSGDTGGSEGPKKKYMGVAKMRRKMIKEQQEKKQEDEPDESSSAPTIPKKFSKVPVVKPVWQIIMHLLTVLFLFSAGFEVGLQQNVIEYREDLTIHETLAPQQELRLLSRGVSFSSSSPSPQILKQPDGDEATSTPYLTEDEDEFESGDKKDVLKEENLDPLFGVDLDALTDGPGLINFMGRRAVGAHRVLLTIFYYSPIAIWNTILSLISSPPVLCLAALAIRQGSHILGGKLPEVTNEDGKSATQPQDIMGTIKNVVGNFFLRAFPTAFKIYDAWTHLRSDMYVILSGLFVGLVWHHYLSPMVTTSVSDEL